MENELRTNDKIVALVKERLDSGQKLYGGDIPINGENNRDNLAESIEEVLDLSIYLSATLLEIQNKRDNVNSMKVTPEDIRLILSGLHSLYSTLYSENQLNLCSEISNLIQRIKETSKWNNKDDKTLIKE